MMQICQDNYDNGIKEESMKRPFGLEWNAVDMESHQERMINIIMRRV